MRAKERQPTSPPPPPLILKAAGQSHAQKNEFRGDLIYEQLQEQRSVGACIREFARELRQTESIVSTRDSLYLPGSILVPRRVLDQYGQMEVHLM